MSAEELSREIWRRPAFYLNNHKSLAELHVFLKGYEAGCRSRRTEDSHRFHMDELRPFSIWLAKELGFQGYSGGWSHMIAERAESEERAFDMFYELFDIRQIQRRKASQCQSLTRHGTE